MAVSDGRLQLPNALENPRKRPPVRQTSQGSSFLQAEFAGIGGKFPAGKRPLDTDQISHPDYGPGSALNQGDAVSLCGRTTADFPGLGAGQDPIDVRRTYKKTTEHSGDSMNWVTPDQSLLFLPVIQRLLQEYVNHVDPCPKLLLCKRIEPLHELRGESEAEHDAVLLGHVSNVMRRHSMCQ